MSVDSIDEILELKQGVRETDLTITNLAVVSLIETALSDWVTRHESPKNDELYWDTPETVLLYGLAYTPRELLGAVSTRTMVGRKVLQSMLAYQEEGMWGDRLKENFLGFIPDDVKLDENWLSCWCGDHARISYREAMQMFADVDPDLDFLRTELSNSIIKLYGKTPGPERSRERVAYYHDRARQEEKGPPIRQQIGVMARMVRYGIQRLL